MKIDHIGYLCSDINRSIREFELLGYSRISEIYTDGQSEEASRNVTICFMSNGNIKIELVCPTGENSDVYNTLKRQGEGPYHICYKTNDIYSQIKELADMGWMILKRPAKAIAFNNARVTFLFKPGIGIIEIVESAGEDKNEA